MGRCLSLFTRLGVVASATAMLLICVCAAHAQDDRYGFVPVPPPKLPAPPAPGQAPPPGAAYGYTPAPAAPPYMPVPAPPQPGYYAAPAASQYGTQIATDPGAYYVLPDNGQRFSAAYRLGPGDKLRVSVFGEEDLSGDYQIDGSGLIRLPLIGTLRAAGSTAPALENTIAGALAQGYLKDPRVNVDIMTYRPFYIIGAVNRPGEYPYVENMSALNAIGLAGGFTEQARQSTLYVRHEGQTREEAVPANQLTRIYPGDVVRVKTTLFWDAMSVFTPLAGPAAIAAAAFN